MTIALDPELESALKKVADGRGIEPEALALEALRAQFITPLPAFESHDDWVRRLRAIGTDCGVSLSDEALGREEMYD